MVEALSDTPVVVVNGARQTGKTTLTRSIPYSGSVEIVTLDDPTSRDAARRDPRAFIDRPVDTLVIDEAQLEPGLFRAIKAEVDRDRRPGRFLLTGSSRLLAATDMADALAGRVEILELWPFSEAEIVGPPHFRAVDAMFDDPVSLLRPSAVTRAHYMSRVFAGGFPEAIDRQPGRRGRWFDSYVTTVTQRVIRELADLEWLTEIPRLVRLCAARTATELNVSSLANEMGLSPRVVGAYMTHLASSFLAQLIPAWSTNLSAKVVRRPKLLLIDSGLAAHLQGHSQASLGWSASAVGPLLETMVGMELRKQIGWSERRPSLWHFRDRGGAEVDFVLESSDGRIVAIEVKATSTPRDQDLKGLRFLADRLGDRLTFGALLTAAPEATRFAPNLAVIPIARLWEHPASSA